jgi:hypothetical protein
MQRDTPVALAPFAEDALPHGRWGCFPEQRHAAGLLGSYQQAVACSRATCDAASSGPASNPARTTIRKKPLPIPQCNS